MNRKALQLAISTLILLILGIVVLIALILAFTGGFERFRSTTDPFLDTTEAIAIKQACEIGCDADSGAITCCDPKELNGEPITCADSRLDISCCKNVACE
jgi:hypothetical protein